MTGICLRKGRRASAHAGASARGFAAVLAVALGMAFSDGASGAKVSKVEEVRDRAEIANLVSALLFADDRHDAEAFAGAFVPDGLLDIVDPRAPVHAQGREAIRGFVRGPAAARNGGAAGARGGADGAPSGAAGAPSGAAGAPGGADGGAPGGPAGMPSGPRNGIRHISFNDYIQIVDRTHARHLSYWMSVRNAAAPRDATDTKLLGISGQDMKILGCGIYEDELVKVDGKWYFQVHRLRFDTVKPE